MLFRSPSQRTYEKVVALRAVESTDGMTADWVHLPYDFLMKVSNDIINKVKGVNRVVYDISSKPPAIIESCAVILLKDKIKTREIVKNSLINSRFKKLRHYKCNALILKMVLFPLNCCRWF